MYKDRFEQFLTEYCENVSEPIRYALLSGGHRIRPILTLCWCELAGGKAEDALSMALAVEMVHSMSLIHDDLPCMDNADIRRGRLAHHKMFGEAAALLTGDELLAYAFSVTASNPEATAYLSSAAMRMAKGQCMELTDGPVLTSDWLAIHSRKTAALMDVACTLGVLAAGNKSPLIYDASAFGNNLGMAYQLLDDAKDGDGICSVITPADARARAKTYLDSCIVQGNTQAADVLRGMIEAVME